MGEVVDILSKQPHISGEFICLECKHRWIGVAPEGTFKFECPNCTLLKGVATTLVQPQETYMCPCGCVHFYLGKDSISCCYCGLDAKDDYYEKM